MNDDAERFKREIDLAAYAELYWGYERSPKESYRSSSVLRNKESRDKIGVSKAPDGHWTYYSFHDETDNGTIIDFVHRRLSGSRRRMLSSDWKAVFEALRPQLGEEAKRRAQDFAHARPALETARPKDPEVVAAAFAKAVELSSWPSPRIGRAVAYLNRRGLRLETLVDERFRGRWRVDLHANVIFPHSDTAGYLQGFEVKNLGFTGFSPQGTKALWRSVALPDDTRLVVGESAIDVMSYYQLQPDMRTQYASTAGQIGERQRALLKEVLAQLRPGTEVVAAFDADSAGAKFTTLLREMAPSRLAFRAHPPTVGKDWNDALKAREAAYIASLDPIRAGALER